MKNRDITRLDMVKGATVLRQGHYDTLAFTPRNSEGEVVDLSGKVINVKIIGQKGIVYETSGSFNVTDSTLQFSISENIGHGEMWMEITVTDPADATYRQKFPTSEYEGKLFFIRSSDDLDYVGFSGKTVAQFEAAQTEFTNKMQQDFDVAVAAVTQDSEVALARMGEASLGAFNQKTTEKLAETSLETDYARTKKADISPPPRNLGARVVFSTDDIQKEDYTILKPIFESEGVPFVLAATSTNVTGQTGFTEQMTDAELLELQNELGCEIAGHTATHPNPNTANMTDADRYREIVQSKFELEAKGFKVTNFIYPFGSAPKKYRDLVSKYYRSGSMFGSNVGVNVAPFKTFDLGRVSLGSIFDKDVPGYPITNTFNDYYKPMVDEAYAKNGLLIFAMHPNRADFDSVQQGYLVQTIQYAKSLGIPIQTLDQALNEVGNVIDIVNFGQWGEETTYFRMSADGKLETTAFDLASVVDDTKNATHHIDTYKQKAVTYSKITTERNGLPVSAEGWLVTDRTALWIDWAVQTFKTKTGDLYERTTSGSVTGAWGAWQEIRTGNIAKVIRVEKNTFNNASLPTAFKPNTITHCHIDANFTGLPVQTTGVLITDRTSTYSDWVFQTYKTKTKTYERVSNTSPIDTWSAWKELPSIKTKKNWWKPANSPVSVPANSHLDLVIDGFPVLPNDVFVVVPYNALPTGLDYYPFMGASGASIRVRNTTGANVSLNTEWNIQLI